MSSFTDSASSVTSVPSFCAMKPTPLIKHHMEMPHVSSVPVTPFPRVGLVVQHGSV
ncbi:hypothetical protein DPMN_044976 [Dreissena polymorpha]|uniref:Uncharacterized protein n=1 Tax=Dreissena polymorpha TaxID=45954 RepID=A0A9D4D559_DREPO|nr:hypothetical protein DPMN_044976 [Dreissena polymorpha]